MNIVLTGFMGTGKSTVGRLLATRLGRPFVDTDVFIEDRHGPIPDIFAVHGEAVFRSFEREAAAELAEQRDLIISTGGGMLLSADVAETFQRTGTVLCLTAPTNQILQRVLDDSAATQRPLLAVDDPRKRIEALLGERAEAYGQFTQISTSDRTPDEVADQIMLELKLN